MPTIKQPFVNYTIGEKDPLVSGRVFTVRLNAREYEDLLKSMIILNISSDSTALKVLAEIGLNVVNTQLQAKTWRWLTDGNRRINESKIHKLKARISENVTQETEIK